MTKNNNMEFIDLHIHTTASDGSCTPQEIVKMALEEGLYAIAITDHDTVSGVLPAIEAASGYPLHVIPGVEISSIYNGQDLHILGYGINYEDPFLVDTLKRVADMRFERNEKMCELLCRNGFDITIDELLQNTSSAALTRGNIGLLMIQKGYVKDMKEAFDKYLAAGACCYVPRFKMPVEDAYKLITYAGGVCSLAHPVQYKMSDKKYTALFKDLKDLGFKCIEAIHSDNKYGDEEKFTKLAEESGLKITGGSDFHGDSKPDIYIGTGRGNIKVPKRLLDNINYTEI